MKLLLCRPAYYGIEYEINPWMNLKNKVEHTLSIKQWENLATLLNSCGAQIEQVQPQPGVPDLTFTANAGLLINHKIILSNFKYFQRQKEIPYYQAWFEQHNFELLNVPGKDQSPFFFEGAGDALFAGNKLFAAYGFRTDRRFYETTSFFKDQKIIFCELADPYFYHLDTCFCPLNEKLAFWYPKAFTIESQKRMSQEIELITVTPSEAKYFACNAIVLNKKIILPSHCPKITNELNMRGYEVFACDMDQFIKAGGACKCLALVIS